MNRPDNQARWLVHLLAGLALALFVALLYYPLLFTNRVLATGDILLYFYPYREAVAAALREGRIPFWNPYLFGGAPLLANPQAAVLYPLHWPLILLSPAQQVYWSAALHTWLLGLGGYALLRRWGANGWAGLATALVLSGAGLVGGLLGHLNQLNVAAWAAWAMICVEGVGFTAEAQRGRGGSRENTGNTEGAGEAGEAGETVERLAAAKTADGRSRQSERATQQRNAAGWPRVLLRGIALAAVVALMLLAGHTQTVYIVLFGLGVWCLWPLAEWLGRWVKARRGGGGKDASRHAAGDDLRLEAGARLAVYGVGVVLGALLSAPQLLPTLELSGLGLRTGGLSWQEATSFSLKPLQLLWTLLPTYGLLSLEALFDTPAYTEFVAYAGLLGLGLAVLGGWRGRGRARAFGVLFVLLGLGLGVGRWNPLYFLLHWLVPGFDLFRVPARWMLLYTLGVAVLAGLGVQWVTQWLAAHQRQENGAQQAARGEPANPHVGVRTGQEGEAGPHVGVGAGQEGGAGPHVGVRTGQEGGAGPHVGVGAGRRMVLAALLLLLLAGDLLLAARALPHSRPTAPEAVDGVRSAPAHLLTDPQRDVLGPAAAPRFLGLSTITFDPGDMADYRRIMREGEPPQLSEEAFNDLVIAQKVQELLVPNLALLWRIPTMDGFDGGVLPLQRYNQFAQLLIPPDQFVPDGRLREQLTAVPAAALLNLMNVQYLITDKVADLWFEDVYYDRQIGATLQVAQPETALTLDETAAGFAATHLDLIAAADAPPAVWAELAQAAAPVAAVNVRGSDALSTTFMLTAGGAPGALLADGALDSPLAQASGAAVAFRDVDGGRQEYRVRLAFDAPLAPQALTLRLLDERFAVRVQAATLYDARTGMFVALLPSDRGHFARVHSGDVKIYANRDLLPRAWLVTQTLAAADAGEAVALLQAQLAANATSAPVTVVEGLPALANAAPSGAGTAEIVRYAPEEVVVRTQSDAPAVLVLSDAFYPGWRAQVDGEETAIYPANVLFRGVALPAGAHTVAFTYTPNGWGLGWALAALGALLAAALGCLAWWGFRHRRTPAV